MQLLMGLMWLFATFLQLLVTLVMTALLHWIQQCIYYDAWTLQDLLLRSGFTTGFRLWSAWLITFLLFAALVTLLVLLGLAAGFATAMWLGWLAALQNPFAHMHPWCHDTSKSASSSAGQMTQWTQGISHKKNCSNNGRSLYGWGMHCHSSLCTHADRTTGYSHLLPQLSLIWGEYRYAWQSQSWMQFLQES